MKEKKEKDLNSIISNMVELSDKGLDSFQISKNLNELGVDTIKFDAYIEKQKAMDNWTKEQWADSWTGDVLTDDGNQIISDEEMDKKITELNEKIKFNQSALEEKKSSLLGLEAKLLPLNNNLQNLNNEKLTLTDKYNNEVIKQASQTMSFEDINISKELSEQLNKEIENLSKHIKKFKKDKHSSVGLLRAVNRRKKLLDYLKKNKIESYKEVISKLNLRK